MDKNMIIKLIIRYERSKLFTKFKIMKSNKIIYKM